MNDKLRIGFVSIEDASDVASWSGIPYHILDALRRQDVSIEVFSPLKRDFRYALAPFKIAARLMNKEICLHHYQIALRSYAKQLEQRMRLNPVDVILSTSTIPITLLECAEPIVFYTDAVFHMMPGYYGALWDRFTRDAIRRGVWQEERALKRCTIGVYSSDWSAEGARKHTQPDKIRVVPFGASMPVHHDLRTVSEWVAERLDRWPAECRLLFIGVEWVRKGGAFAVETVRLLREMGVNAKLTVVGCRPNEEAPLYVEVLGFVDKRTSEGQKQLEELFRQATFFLLPTRAEAAGIVFCEASAFGVPSITFQTGGVENYVREGINGICLPLDSEPQLFARHIKETVEDKDRYYALSIGAFNEYITRLNWDSTAGTLVNLCNEAVQSQRADRLLSQRKGSLAGAL